MEVRAWCGRRGRGRSRCRFFFGVGRVEFFVLGYFLGFVGGIFMIVFGMVLFFEDFWVVGSFRKVGRKDRVGRE